MKTIKGPAIFLAQFISDKPPFNSLENIVKWAASLGYIGIQIPTWDHRIFDLQKAAENLSYAEEIKGIVESAGLVITELTSHLQGQLIACHPSYAESFEIFAPDYLKGNAESQRLWAVQQLKWSALASRNLGLNSHATFSGALLWQFVYPWPQRKKGDVQNAFDELAKRWLPILNDFEEAGVDLCYEIHPGEDLHDGITFEIFLQATKYHNRAKILYDPSHFLLQQLDYLSFIDIYHPLIKMFHVKDAEFRPNGKSGMYGGYQDWLDRPGRFRSLGDGQIDFKSIFSKFTQYDFPGWAVLEWECCLKNQEDGAREGAEFIKNHIIRTSEKAFDDFAG